MKNSQDNNRRMIQEAIRKIALGRSIERIEMAPGGMGGVGTARMIHGYVAKIHDDPSDEEFADYGGTVDVGEYPDETASAGGIIHKGVLLAAARNNEGGSHRTDPFFGGDHRSGRRHLPCLYRQLLPCRNHPHGGAFRGQHRHDGNRGSRPRQRLLARLRRVCPGRTRHWWLST